MNMIRGLSILAIVSSAMAQQTFAGMCDSTVNPCFTKSQCSSTMLSPTQVTCGSCPSGYSGDGATCTDINECAAVNHPCLTISGSTCQNTVGSYNCVCSSGYNTRYTSGKMYCDDINECTAYGTSPCASDATCENTAGSYKCTCNNNMYTPHPVTRQCTEVKNLCTYDNGSLNPCEQVCTFDSMTGANCSCNEGYTMDPVTQKCVDVNECTNGTHQCKTGTCTNTVGSYTCSCKEGDGVTPDGNGRCANYNECLYVTDACSSTQCCRDLEPGSGKYECLAQVSRLRRLSDLSSTLFASSLFTGVSSSELPSDSSSSTVSSKKCPANSQTMSEWASQRRSSSGSAINISDDTKYQWLNSFFTGTLDHDLATAVTNLTVGGTKITEINSPLFQYPVKVITNLASAIEGSSTLFSGWFGST